MEINQKSLKKLGFSPEGAELGDDGAMELELEDHTVTWVGTLGRYTENWQLGIWVSQNDRSGIAIQISLEKIPDIKTLKSLIKILGWKN